MKWVLLKENNNTSLTDWLTRQGFCHSGMLGQVGIAHLLQTDFLQLQKQTPPLIGIYDKPSEYTEHCEKAELQAAD